MNISYEDGSHSFGPFDAEKLAREAERPDFVSAKVYQPGKTVTVAGREYRVGQAGNLIRTDKIR
jgi:hypothetical protein